MSKVLLLENAGADETGDTKALPFKQGSISALGTFSGSAEVHIELSEDGGSNWYPMNDTNGNPVVITAETIDIWMRYKASTDNIRARTVNGDGSTDITVAVRN